MAAPDLNLLVALDALLSAGSVAQRAAGPATLHRFELPVAVEGITVSQMWHPRLHADAGHRWLRELVLAQCRRLTAHQHGTG